MDIPAQCFPSGSEMLTPGWSSLGDRCMRNRGELLGGPASWASFKDRQGPGSSGPLLPSSALWIQATCFCKSLEGSFHMSTHLVIIYTQFPFVLFIRYLTSSKARHWRSLQFEADGKLFPNTHHPLCNKSQPRFKNKSSFFDENGSTEMCCLSHGWCHFMPDMPLGWLGWALFQTRANSVGLLVPREREMPIFLQLHIPTQTCFAQNHCSPWCFSPRARF